MEDYSRDLEKELNKYSVPNPFKQTRNWQLLFVSDDGKTIAVKRYKGLVISVSVVLIIAILFSFGLTVLYYKSSVEKKSLKLAVEKANKALSRVTEEKELLNARLFFEKKDDTQIVETSIDEAGVKKKENESLTTKSPEQPVVEKTRVGVEDISMIKTEGSRLTKIRFLIRNLSKLKRISGYVFVVLKPESEKQKDWRVLPPVLLRNGEPAVTGRGRYFAINHFKSMNFKFNDNIESSYKSITVFVYLKSAEKSKANEKIFESTFPVNIKILKKKVAPVKKDNKEKNISQNNSVPKVTDKPERETKLAGSEKEPADKKSENSSTLRKMEKPDLGKKDEKADNDSNDSSNITNIEGVQ